MGRYLDMINTPEDVKVLTPEQLNTLAQEIRDELITKLAKHGGHLGPNLGVVELTLAMHRVFETPKDKFVWDVSHQVYVHKLLTGRRDRFRAGAFGRRRLEDGPRDLREGIRARGRTLQALRRGDRHRPRQAAGSQDGPRLVRRAVRRGAAPPRRTRPSNVYFRQLVHVGFKVAAELGDAYCKALETHADTIGRLVTENLLEKHIKRVFFPV